jgi:hypothetical protein
VRQGKSCTTVNLVNLRGLHDSLWNAFKETPAPLTGLTVSVTLPEDEAQAIKRGWLASPDSAAAQEITIQRQSPGDKSQRLSLELSRLDYWSLLILENEF